MLDDTHPPDPPLRQGIGAAITPLRLVFWGGLLCVLDLSFGRTANGSGWTFDLLNDFVGMLMVTVGVLRLRAVGPAGPYDRAMGFVVPVAVLASLAALHDHAVYDVPLPLVLLFSLLGLASLAATLVFCLAMQWLCRAAYLERSEASWRTTTLLFVFVYLIPLGLLQLVGLLALLGRSSFHMDLGPMALLLLPVFCLPLIHLFVSTSRMRREVEEQLDEAEEPWVEQEVAR